MARPARDRMLALLVNRQRGPCGDRGRDGDGRAARAGRQAHHPGGSHRAQGERRPTVTVHRVLSPSRTDTPDFAALYVRYYPVVLAFVSWRTRDALLAEEITAQTFLQALQAFHRYEDRGLPVSSWLYRIARN